MGSGDSGSGSRLARLLPRRIRERFVYKFLLSVLVVMVLTAGIGAFFFGTTTATLTDRTEGKMQSTAQLQADQLDRWVEGLAHQTRLLSEAPAFEGDNRSEIDFYLLNRLQTLSDDVSDVHYIDSNTMTVEVSTTDSVEGTNLSAAGVPWASERAGEVAIRTNLAERVVVGRQPYESPASGEQVLAFVSAPPRNTEHVVVVEANLSSCGAAFDQPTDGAYTTVHGPDGSAVCGGSSGLPSGVGEGDTENGTAGVTTTGDEVAGYATVGATGWTLVSHAPKSAAFGLRQEIGTSMLVLVLVPLLGIGVVAVVVGRRSGRELDRLTDRAAAMREGDLDVDIATGRDDEFGDLARGFAEMRDALRQQIEEAEQARREAEVSRAEAMEMNDYLQEKAADYSETMAACARGDLTQRMDADGENDAMDRIAADFNEMLRELELTTGQLQSFAEAVREGGEDVHASSETVKEASEQVADSIQRVSDDAYEQKERLRTVSQEMTTVAGELESLAADHPDLDFSAPLTRIRAVSERLDAAADAAEDVMAESETVAGAAEEQAAELAEVSSRALELKRNAGYLGDGISHFETDEEHEFVFQTGAGENASQ